MTTMLANGNRPGSTIPAEAKRSKRFCLILVKPSHYDDDGYVIQWFRSTIPSNSLAAVYGLARDCQQRQTLGPDVEMFHTPSAPAFLEQEHRRQHAHEHAAVA